MPRQRTELLAFNRGLVSDLGAARRDVKRVALAAKQQTNWVPRRLGSMTIRPGLAYKASSHGNATARYVPFIFATDDTALVEFTDSTVRVLVSETPITRPSVTSAVTNGTFDTDVASWTDSDESGGTSVWVTGGYLGLTGNGTAHAIRDQTISVTGANLGVEHALRIVVSRGPVTLKVGTSAGDDSYIRETALATGTHSLALTPTGNFYIRVMNHRKTQSLVSEISIEAAGVMTLSSPYLAADLDFIRTGPPELQSGDVLFIACDGYQQRKIERRAARSWSLVTYQPEDGPFRITNTDPTTITPSAISGNITLTASQAIWRSTHVGALWRITSSGQVVDADVTGANQFTTAIRVIGVDSQRVFSVVITGTWVATVTLQRSLASDTGPWEDVTTWTVNTTTTHDDGLDNQEAWYRIGVKTAQYTSGTVEISLDYNVGSVDGVVRITGYSSATSVTAEVFVDLGGIEATSDWAEGAWSDMRGWPSAGSFYEGRLLWAGKSGIWASVSDAFDSFDDATEGDSGPISRTVGSGPVDVVNWMMPLGRLIVGAQGSEFSVRASSLDEILTPSNFNVKPASSQGSAAVQAVKIDARAAFIQRGGTRAMELDLDQNGIDYTANDLTVLCPEITKPGVLRLAVQRQPDTRVHAVLADGNVAMLVYDKVENMLCWVLIETDGVIEDVVVLPGEDLENEDRVYYSVARSINGATVRFLERWATEDECIGGAVNLLADAHVTYTGAATTTITGLDHLEGENVVVWANGVDVGTASDHETLTYTVSGGQITLATAATNVTVGLPYTARFKSGKLLTLQAALGTPLSLTRQISGLGVILKNTHRAGLWYGPDFDHLDQLSGIVEGAPVSASTVHTDYDDAPFPFPGTWSTDSRLCLEARAPRPATVVAATLEVPLVD